MDNLKLGERGHVDAVLVTNLAGDASVSRQEISGSDDAGTAEAPGGTGVDNGGDPVDYFFAASHLLDLVPNPWQVRDLARRTFEALLERYSAERVAANHVFVLEELRRRIERERDRLSREVFRTLLESGRMRFWLSRTISSSEGKAGESGGWKRLPTQPLRHHQGGRSQPVREQGRDLPGPAGGSSSGTATAPARTTTCRGGSRPGRPARRGLRVAVAG